MTHQITLQICQECYQGYLNSARLVLMRRSHRWSFWCEHAVTEDWYPGSSAPLGMRVEIGP